jgi:hypothetical protein
MRSPSTLHVHHHDGSTVMTNRCTNSFHALRIDRIGKEWEATLIRGNDDPFAKVKFMIPPFYGLYDAEAYLDWEMTVDNKFSSHLVPKKHHVRLATSEFKVFAIIWWSELSSPCLQTDTWDRLKAAMRERFVPPAYQCDLRKKLQCLGQGDMSAQDYYAELQKGMIHAGVYEEMKDKTCFYSGLHTKIQDIVNYKEYNTVNHLFQLTMLAKKELQGHQTMKTKTSFTPRSAPMASSRTATPYEACSLTTPLTSRAPFTLLTPSTTAPRTLDKSKASILQGSAAPKPFSSTVPTRRTSDIRCHHCHGIDHF